MKDKQLKAIAILWLNDMKSKGRNRLKAIRCQLANGQIDLSTLQHAKQKQEAIEKLLALLNEWELSMDDLHQKIKELNADRRQQKLFHSKNPL